MARRLLLVFILLSALVLFVPRPSAAQEAGPTVEIQSNEFVPSVIKVEPNTRVTWKLSEGNHTVTADDRSFRFTGMGIGDTKSHLFDKVGTFTYYCELHGTAGGYPSGMSGVVYVGVDPPVSVPEVREVPSKAYPTLESAVTGIPPRSTVLVKSGTYRLQRELQLGVDHVTLRAADRAVVLEPAPGGDADVGIVVAAKRVTVENITVRGFPWAAVLVDEVNAKLVNVATVGGAHGIRVLRGTVDINGSRVTGATVAGVSVVDCEPLDLTERCVYIDGGAISGPGTGIAVTSSGPVTVTRARVDVAGTAIDLRSSVGALVVENPLVRSANGDGIAVTGGAVRTAVKANIVSGRSVGLRWDGIGVDVCFSGNLGADGASAATSDPAPLQTLPCEEEVPYR